MYTVKNNYEKPVQYQTLKDAWGCPEAEQIRSSIDFDKFTDLIIEHLALAMVLLFMLVTVSIHVHFIA